MVLQISYYDVPLNRNDKRTFATAFLIVLQAIYVQVRCIKMWRSRQKPSLRAQGATMMVIYGMAKSFVLLQLGIDLIASYIGNWEGFSCGVSLILSYGIGSTVHALFNIRLWVHWILSSRNKHIVDRYGSRRDVGVRKTGEEDPYLEKLNFYFSDKFLFRTSALVATVVIVIFSVVVGASTDGVWSIGFMAHECFAQTWNVRVTTIVILSINSFVSAFLLFKLIGFPSSRPVKIQILAFLSFTVYSNLLGKVLELDFPFYFLLFLGQMAFILTLFWYPLYQDEKAQEVLGKRPSNSFQSFAEMLRQLFTGEDGNKNGVLLDETSEFSSPLDATIDLTGAPKIVDFQTALRNPQFIDVFEPFLVRELCIELLVFWKAVQDFRSACDADPQEARVHMDDIMQRFINVGSVMEINLSYQLRKEIIQSANQVRNNQESGLSKEIFVDAESECVKLMFTGAFMTFRNARIKAKALKSTHLSH